jgi:hypothetical protein
MRVHPDSRILLVVRRAKLMLNVSSNFMIREIHITKSMIFIKALLVII